MEKDRRSNLELLRIVAMAMILVVHFDAACILADTLRSSLWRLLSRSLPNPSLAKNR